MHCNLGVFEDAGYAQLLPLTWLRASCELLCGCDTLLEKLRAAVPGPLARLWVRPDLAPVVARRLPMEPPDASAPWCLWNARALVSAPVAVPAPGVVWVAQGEVVAAGVAGAAISQLDGEVFTRPDRLAAWCETLRPEAPPAGVALLRYPWELVQANATELRRQAAQFAVATSVPNGVHLVNPAEIRLAPTARIKPGAVLDAEDGPIIVGEGALIESLAVVQGPCFIGPRTIVRPGAVLRGGTSLGPVCRVGGEVEGSILLGYSNKQHDGFLGHSYVAQWVNLGADTVTSDLKNTYGTIRVFLNGQGVESGQRFIGSTIGDHSKTGIGTLLPTGCVVGVAANVFTAGRVPKFVPSFAWLTDEGLMPYRVDKAVEVARTVMGRRQVELDVVEAGLLKRVASEARHVERFGWDAVH
ncbi:MAG: hypothetical protein IPM18_11720 [Phycisphaerales bacterium]|nr:hypothetical protein [Phycisphaerales bacterium]